MQWPLFYAAAGCVFWAGPWSIGASYFSAILQQDIAKMYKMYFHKEIYYLVRMSFDNISWEIHNLIFQFHIKRVDLIWQFWIVFASSSKARFHVRHESFLSVCLVYYASYNKYVCMHTLHCESKVNKDQEKLISLKLSISNDIHDHSVEQKVL